MEGSQTNTTTETPYVTYDVLNVVRNYVVIRFKNSEYLTLQSIKRAS